MGSITLNSIIIKKEKLTYDFCVSDDLKFFFSNELFTIEYQENIESVPNGVLAIPFVCNVLPIIWLEDAELIIPELDEDFYNSIPEFKKGYINMYPEAKFAGKIRVGKIVNCRKDNINGSAVFFSGGVDATTTLVRHIDEKPYTVTLWGADIAFNNKDGWNTVYPLLKKSAEDFGLLNEVIHSSFRLFDSESALQQKYQQLLGKGWWYGAKHGIGIISHIAPIVWLHGIDTVYFASSNCPEDGDKVKCASDPRIDNFIRFCGCRVVHDGFELNRQKKVKVICDFHKSHKDIPISLHVCWESPTGTNCCHCEKCYRTMAEFWAEGEDPKEYGLYYSENVFKEMERFIIYDCISLAKKTWTRTKERMIENWSEIQKFEFSKSLKWITITDFKNIENNKKRLARKRKRILLCYCSRILHPKHIIKKYIFNKK